MAVNAHSYLKHPQAGQQALPPSAMQTPGTQSNTHPAAGLPPSNQPCVLILEAERVTCDALASYLKHYHPHQPVWANATTSPPNNQGLGLQVLTASTPAQAQAALNCLHPQQPVVLMADLATLRQADDDWLMAHRQRLPKLKLVLMSALWLEDCLSDMLRLETTHLLTKTVPFEFAELSTLIHLLFNPQDAKGLTPYLPVGAPVQTLTLRCSEDIMTAFFTLQAFFAETQVLQPDDLATAMIEAITNAVYHATPDPTNPKKDKYDKGQVIDQLEANEFVTVSYATLGNTIALCVSDQKGRLTAKNVLYWLQRNMSGDNLLNTHGRGLFLMYTLCQRFSLHLHAGHQTDVVVVACTHEPDSNTFAMNPKMHPNKPLLIHVT